MSKYPCAMRLRIAEARYEDAGVLRSLLHMVYIVEQAFIAQTGCASPSTLSRNLAGKSAGVSKSTRMPSSASSSI